ncbi:MAG: sigma-54-dependent transcriptional regulator [Burkholderiales bacterium]
MDSGDRGCKVKPKILLVDDDPYTQQLFEGLLRGGDNVLRVAGDIAEARNEFHAADFNLVLLDQRLPDGNGLEFFKEIRALRPQQVAILITGHADLRDAIGAVRGGLFDYLTKPFKNLDELSAIIARALEMDRAYREISNLQAALEARPGRPVIVGRSAAMQRLFQQIQRIAPLDTTVLIEGESGTGKELMARQIHELSPRAMKPFVGLNCGGLSESLLEATLFGYEKPAFTSGSAATPGYFEEATGGTLVLDELGELSRKLQSSLLRVLQERTYSRLGSATQRTSDFRLICTSGGSLEDRVRAGDFRSDLYYRINVNLLRVPPLRERREDIVALALLFLDQFNIKFGRAAGPFVPETLAALEAAPWPGNVRELQHVIERAVVVNVRGPIVVADLALGAHDRAGGDREAAGPASFEEARERFERAYFIDLLHAAGGNVSEAARQSHISRQALHRYLKQLGIVTKS